MKERLLNIMDIRQNSSTTKRREMEEQGYKFLLW